MNIKDWILEKQKAYNSPFVVGISGAQGIGKTTLTNKLVNEFNSLGIKIISISIDDFYLTRNEQQKLTDSTNNPYLEQRGYPGTHDIPLAIKTLTQLKHGKSTIIPRYDKSKHSGLGDRSPKEAWTKISKPQDIILIEGWFLGFEPIENINDKNLIAINENLKKYKAFFNLFDELIYLKPKYLEDVIQWRIEAEKNMRALGKESMSDKQIKAYIEKFIPAYNTYRNTVKASVEYAVNTDRTRELST